MSKAFGGIDKLLKPKHKRERAKVRALHLDWSAGESSLGRHRIREHHRHE